MPLTRANSAANTLILQSLGSGLTFSTIKIDQAGAGTLELAAKVASETQRLHELVGTIDAGGKVQIQDKDGVDVDGDMPFDANGGINYVHGHDSRGALSGGAVNKGLQIVTTDGGFHGHAVVSTGV